MALKFFKNSIKWCLQRTFPQSILLSKLPIKGIVITFDDGPHPKNTSKIIKYLSAVNAKAIFFATGKEIEKFPEMAELIVKHGHTLGNHTYEHLDLCKCSFEEYKDSIIKTNHIITSFQQSNNLFFRPPYGRMSLQLLKYIIASELTMMNWTIDSRDSFIKDPNMLLAYVKKLNVTQGDILLFHEDYNHTLKILPNILSHYREQGFNFIQPAILRT